MLILTSLNDPRLPALLQQGAVGVAPTDTIYGLVGDARNHDTVERLYSLKHREHKPGTIIAADIEQLIDLGVDEAMIRSIAHVWPNPISVVIPAARHLSYLDQNVGSLAVRVPANDVLHKLLAHTGPLVTSSANLPGETPAVSVAEAQAYFGGKVDFYIDGGNMGNRPPSTVVRLHEDGSLELLRQGTVIVKDGKVRA